MKDKNVIPKGPYCYEARDKYCPYFEIVEDKPAQMNGYCHYLEQGDWEFEHFGLLWDAVKECGINDEEEEDEA